EVEADARLRIELREFRRNSPRARDTGAERLAELTRPHYARARLRFARARLRLARTRFHAAWARASALLKPLSSASCRAASHRSSDPIRSATRAAADAASSGYRHESAVRRTIKSA